MLKDTLNLQIWKSYSDYLFKKIKSNYDQVFKNFNNLNFRNIQFDLVEKFVKNFINVVLIGYVAYLIINYNFFSINNLPFLVYSLQVFKNSISSIFQFLIENLNANIYYDVYLNLIKLHNLVNTTKEKQIKNCEVISLDNKISLFRNKTAYLKTQFLCVLKQANKILIDNTICKLNDKYLYCNLIHIQQNTNFSVNKLLEIVKMKTKLYSFYLTKLNLDLCKKIFSFKEKLVINLLIALNETNKIIVFDQIKSVFSDTDNLITELFIAIEQKNFVFYVEYNDIY